MALETASFINSLVVTNPAATDPIAQSDDHIRLLKTTIKASFPGITGAVNATHTELNTLDGITATTAELNLLDGVTASTTEINLLDGVTASTSELNTLDGVTATSTELNVLDGITATTTELNYTDGVTSNIQTQLNTLDTTVSNIAGYPQVITLLTSGSSYTIPSDAQAVLIRASGGGGGGSVHANPGTGGLGTNSYTQGNAGGTTTVTNSALGISISATGGARGTVGGSATTSQWRTASTASGGDIYYNKGATGGRTTGNHYDVRAQEAGNGNVVQKYVTGSQVAGKVLSYSLGAGGAGGSNSGGSIQPEDGQGGYVELIIW